MGSYYLLFKKRDGKLYEDTTYEASMIPVIESEITKAELAKREARLKEIEVIEGGIDVTLDCMKRTQCKMKINKEINLGGLDRVFEDIHIIIDHIDEFTFDIIFRNLKTKKTFDISQLGENAYKNVFNMYKKCLHWIKSYSFSDNYEWKRISIPEQTKTGIFRKIIG